MSSEHAKEHSEDETERLLKQMLRFGEYEQALTLMQTFLSDEGVDLEARLKLIKVSCQILMLKGMHDECQMIATKSLEKARKIGTPLLRIDFMLILAQSLLLQQSVVQAQSMLDSAWELLELIRKDFPLEKVYERQCLIEIIEGDIHFQEGLLEESLSFYKKAMKIAMDVKNPNLIGKTLLRLGRVYAEQQNHEQSLYYLNQSLVLLAEHGDLLDLIECFEQLATVHANLGKFETAIKFQQDKLSMLAETGNSREMARCLAEIGWLSQQIGKLDSAVKYCMQSLELYQRLGDQLNAAYCHVDLAHLLRKKGEWDDALTHAHYALAVFTELNDTRELIQTSLLIAQIYRQKNDLTRAVQRYEEALGLLKDRRYLADLLLEALYWIILIYLTLKDMEQAKKYYHHMKIVSAAQAPDLPVEQVKKLMGAIIYKEFAESNLSLVKTKKKFQELLKEEPFSATYVLRTYVHACDLLLHESLHCQGYEFLEKMNEISVNLEKITQMCFTLNEHLLGIEYMLIRARILAFLRQDTTSLELLSQAMYLARENGLNKIIAKITIIADFIMENLRKKTTDQHVEMAETELRANHEGKKLVTDLLNHFQELKLEILGYEEFPLPSHAREELLFIGGISGFPLYVKIIDETKREELRILSRKLSSHISFKSQHIHSSEWNVDLGLLKGYKYVLRFDGQVAYAVIFDGPMYFSWRKIEDSILLVRNNAELWSLLQKKARAGKFLNEEETTMLEKIIQQSDIWN